jgi:hypothetical protein
MRPFNLLKQLFLTTNTIIDGLLESLNSQADLKNAIYGTKHHFYELYGPLDPLHELLIKNLCSKAFLPKIMLLVVHFRWRHTFLRESKSFHYFCRGNVPVKFQSINK